MRKRSSPKPRQRGQGNAGVWIWRLTTADAASLTRWGEDRLLDLESIHEGKV